MSVESTEPAPKGQGNPAARRSFTGAHFVGLMALGAGIVATTRLVEHLIAPGYEMRRRYLMTAVIAAVGLLLGLVSTYDAGPVERPAIRVPLIGTLICLAALAVAIAELSLLQGI